MSLYLLLVSEERLHLIGMMQQIMSTGVICQQIQSVRLDGMEQDKRYLPDVVNGEIIMQLLSQCRLLHKREANDTLCY
jgi:hypothetical protein